MSAKVNERPEEAAPEPGPAVEDRGPTEGRTLAGGLLRVVTVLAALAGAVFVLWWSLDFARGGANRFLVMAVAIAVGVGGVFLLFWAMNRVVDWLPARLRESFRPYVFVGPALVILSVFLVYPVINTIILSFRDARGEDFVGWENFSFVFSNESMLRSIRNTAGWIILVPLVGTATGLAFATLADRLHRTESVAKSVIFMPMAISFVGAAVTWQFIYSFRPEGFGGNIGLLNGIMEGLGQEPVRWLQQRPWNNLYLMVIMVWMQTGFAMVVLSAAIKAIPDEIIEAARIDGASEMQVFRRIVVPSILPTIMVVATYMVINALKVFDIVYVIGSPEINQTEVIAERMVNWFFLGSNSGRGAAIAVILFLAVIPIMVWNVRRFREQEAIR